MRYYINFDKMINQLIPHYMGGRRLILYLQALLKPLQVLNDEFVQYAKEQRIEAMMTSQIGKFEWYLNYKFGKYFNTQDKIVIKNSASIGLPIYYQNADIDITDNMLVTTEIENEDTAILYHQNENIGNNAYSFIVESPTVDTNIISLSDYEALLASCINKYKLANKTFTIIYKS